MSPLEPFDSLRAQYVQISSLVSPDSHRVAEKVQPGRPTKVRALATSLLIKLPAAICGKKEDGQSAWPPVPE